MTRKVIFLIAFFNLLLLVTDAFSNDCGSKKVKLGGINTEFWVPQGFPLESNIASIDSSKSIADILPEFDPTTQAMQLCVWFGKADFQPTCRKHDLCYETWGKTREFCDKEAREGWVGECKTEYANKRLSPDNPARTICRDACVKFARLMGEGLITAPDKAWNESESERKPDGTSEIVLMGGSAADVAVGPTGQVWIVDNESIPDTTTVGGMIRKNTGGSTWDDLKTFIRAKKIAVAPDGTVWMVNGKGEIHYLSPGSSTPNLCGGTTRDVAVGKNGDVWIVDNDEIPDSNKYGGMIRKHTGNCTWDVLKKDIRCTNIAVAPDGTVWMVNGIGEIHYLRTGDDNPTQAGTKARDIAVGANGDVWMVDNDEISESNQFGGMVRKFTGDISRGEHRWDKLRTDIRTTKIAVGPNGELWLVNGAGHVHKVLRP